MSWLEYEYAFPSGSPNSVASSDMVVIHLCPPSDRTRTGVEG